MGITRSKKWAKEGLARLTDSKWKALQDLRVTVEQKEAELKDAIDKATRNGPKIRRRPDPHRFLLACRGHGWKPQARELDEQVRDAAHEAFHALTVGLFAWDDREILHRQLTRHFEPAGLWVHEIEARVTEQEVVRIFGLETKPLALWLHMSAMEAIRTRTAHGDPDRALLYAERFPRARVRANARRILRLEPMTASPREDAERK